MAENLDIVVTERGAREVQRSINAIGAAAIRASAPMRNLQALLASYVSLQGLRNLTRLTDEYTEMGNRIRVLDGVSGDYTSSLRRLYDISQETRSSLRDNVLLFQRMGLAQKELNASSNDLFKVTRAVGQAIAIQGGLATTSAGAVLQLSQAFGSGRVQLEEFNSVITGIYPIAKAAADGIDAAGGSIAKLRRMIADGEVDSRALFQGILKSVSSLDEQFLKTTPTIAQAFTILHNSVLMTVGDFNKATGASESFARVLINLSNNLDDIILGASALVAAGLPILIGKITLEVIKLARAIKVLMFTNPFTAILSLASGALAYFVLFNDELDKIDSKTQKYVTAVDRLGAAWAGTLAYVKAAWADFPRWLGEIIDSAITIAISKLSKIGSFVAGGLGLEDGSYMSNMLKSLDFDVPPAALDRLKTNGQDAAKAFYSAYQGYLKDAQARHSSVLGDPDARPGLENQNTVDEKTIKKLRRELDSLVSSIDPVAGAWLEWGKAQKTIEESLNAGLITLDQYNQLMGQAYRNYELQLSPLGKFNDEIDKQIGLLSIEVNERERLQEIYSLEDELKRKLTATEREHVEARLKAVQALSNEREVLDEIVEPMNKYMDRLTALNSLLGKGSISTDDFVKKTQAARIEFLESKTDAASGYERALLKLQESAGDAASATEDMFTSSFGNISEAVQDFVTTGKLSFSDLANSILKDLVRISAQQALVQPFAKLFEGTSGFGIMSGGGGGLLSNFFGGGAGLQGIAEIGFARGGYTGPGGKYDIAGPAHKGEYIFDRESTNAIGVDVLNQIRKGRVPNRQINVPITIIAKDADSFRKSQSQISREMGAAVNRAQARG